MGEFRRTEQITISAKQNQNIKGTVTGAERRRS